MRFILLAGFLLGCSTAASDVPVDASPYPTRPAGTFEVRTVLDLPLPDPPAIAELVAATDDPDDPSRYLVDRVVAALPDGRIKTVAQALAPYVAADLNGKLQAVAPRLLPGLRTLVDGLSRISRRFETVEEVVIAGDGSTTRTIVGVQFDKIAATFADAGVTDAQSSMRTTLDRRGGLAIGEHVIALPYAAIVRIGFDRAVIPMVDPSATDAAGALRDLVDCPQVGAEIADYLGIGAPSLYASACDAGLIKLAHDVYAQLDAIAPISLDTKGVARAMDGNGDGTMDAFDEGAWSGSVLAGAAAVPVSARFAGSRR